MTGVIKSINWVLFKTTSENRVNVYGLIEAGDAEKALRETHIELGFGPGVTNIQILALAEKVVFYNITSDYGKDTH